MNISINCRWDDRGDLFYLCNFLWKRLDYNSENLPTVSFQEAYPAFHFDKY